MYVVENVDMNTQGSYNWNWIDACAHLEGFLFMTFSYYRSWIEGRSNNKADMMTSWKRKRIQGARGCTSWSHGRSHFLKPGGQWCSHWSNGNRHQQNPSAKPNLSFSRVDSRCELPTQAMQLTQHEEREPGNSGTQIYRYYVQTSKEWWMFAGMIVAEFFSIILQVATTDVKRCTKLKICVIFFVVVWSICLHLEIKTEQVECWRLNKFHIGRATHLFRVCKMQVSWQISILE